MGELHKKVCIKPDVEVQVVNRGLRLLNMQRQALVQKPNGLVLVTALSPLDDGLEERMLSRFPLGLADLGQELELLLRVVDLLLAHAAVNDPVQRLQVVLVVLGGPLEYLDRRVVVSQETLLRSELGVVDCILGLLGEGDVHEL